MERNVNIYSTLQLIPELICAIVTTSYSVPARAETGGAGAATTNKRKMLYGNEWRFRP